MKKLSLLVALFMCLTIGGVYATWSYAGTNDIADSFAEAKVTIADAELTGANGTYKIESNLVLTVDQANDEHEAELIFAGNDGKAIYLTITFTPATNAPLTIKKDGVPSELYFGTTTAMQYKMDAQGNYSETGTPTDIFVFSNVGNGVIDEPFTWTKHGEDENGICSSFTYSIGEAELRAMIQLNDNEGKNPFVLDTKAEHDAFRTALSGNIVARVSDGVFTE